MPTGGSPRLDLTAGSAGQPRLGAAADSPDRPPWFDGLVNEFVQKRVGKLSMRGYTVALDEFHELLGAVLREARELDGLTQQGVADAVGKLLGDPIGQSWVDKAESRCAPAQDRFAAAAAALRFPPSVLVVTAEAGLALGRRDRRYRRPERRSQAVAQLLKDFRQLLGEGAAGVPAEAREAARAWCDPGPRVHAWFVAAVAAALKLIRLRRGLSQAAVARELHERFGHPASKASVSQTECGQSPPSWARLAALAQIFGVSLSQVCWAAEGEAARAARPPRDQLQEFIAQATARLAECPAGLGPEEGQVFAELKQLLEAARLRCRSGGVTSSGPPEEKS
jgi:transcriptional regulator with XRE-family HTH domain